MHDAVAEEEGLQRKGTGGEGVDSSEDRGGEEGDGDTSISAQYGAQYGEQIDKLDVSRLRCFFSEAMSCLCKYMFRYVYVYIRMFIHRYIPRHIHVDTFEVAAEQVTDSRLVSD